MGVINNNKYWFDITGTKINQETDAIQGFTSSANRITALSPLDSSYIASIAFLLNNGRTVPFKTMIQDGNEDYLSTTYNIWYIDLGFDVLSTISMLTSSPVQFQIRFQEQNGDYLGSYETTNSVLDDTDESAIDTELKANFAGATDGQYVTVFNTTEDASITYEYDLETTAWVYLGYLKSIYVQTIRTVKETIAVESSIDALDTELSDSEIDIIRAWLNGQEVDITDIYSKLKAYALGFDQTDDIGYSTDKAIYDFLSATYYTKAQVDGTFYDVAGDQLEGTMDANQNDITNIGSLELYNAGGTAVATYDGQDVIFTYGGKNVEMAKNLFTRIKAEEAISEGDVVQYAGSVGASGEIWGKKAIPSEINANPYLIIGIATEDISNNQEGEINFYGRVNGIDTSAYTAGSVLYFDSESASNGLLTETQPVAPSAQIVMALVTVSHNTNGQLSIRPKLGSKISELHDVYLNGGVSDGDLLEYDNANSRWKNTNKSAITVGKATADAGGNVITTTYATVAYVDGAVSGLYDYKGTVATYADLPSTGNETGDVYNVTNDENTGNTGVNYAWNGTAWDNIGGEVRLATSLNDGLLSSFDYDQLQALQDNLDAKVDKSLVGLPEVTTANGTEKMFARDGVTDKFITVQEIADFTGGLSSSVNSQGNYFDTGLGAHVSAFDFVFKPTEPTTPTGAQISLDLINTTILSTFYTDSGIDKIIKIRIPDSLTNEDSPLKFSIDNDTTYHNIKFGEDNVTASQILGEEFTLIYRNDVPASASNGYWELFEGASVSQSLPYKSAVGQHTIPFNEVPTAIPYKTNAGLDEAQGQLVEQILANPDLDSTTNWSLSNATGSVTDSVYSFTATAQFGAIIQNYSFIDGSDYYIIARVKANTSNVVLRSTPNNIDNHSGSGNYEILKGILTASSNTNVNVRDESTSGWTQIDVDYVQAIPLPSGITTQSGIEAVLDGTVLSQGFHATGEARTYVPSDYPASIQDFIENKQGIASGEQINGVYYETVGKNKFDGLLEIGGLLGDGSNDDASTDRIRSANFIPINGGLTYKGSIDVSYTTGFIAYYDIDFNVIGARTTWGSLETIAPSNARYLKFMLTGTTDTEANFQLELGTTATTYEAYENSVQHIDTSGMYSLPNGVRDTLVSKKIEEYTLQESDIILIFDRVGIDYAIIQLPNNASTTSTKLLNTYIEGFSGVWNATYDDVSNLDKITTYSSSNKQIGYGIVDGTSLVDARTLLVGKKVYYELATPTARTIEVNGEQIVSTNSTYSVYSPVLPYKWYVSSAYSRNAQIDLGVQQDIEQGKKLLEHDGRLDVVETRLNGSHHHFENIILTAASGNPAFIPDYDYTENMFLFPQNDTTEVVQGTIFLEDRRIPNTDVFLRVHAYQNQNTQPVMKFEYKVFEANGGTVPASYTTYTVDTWDNAYTSGTISNILRDTVAIDTTGLTGRLIIKFNLYRDDNVYVGDLKVDEVAVLYTVENFDEGE